MAEKDWKEYKTGHMNSEEEAVYMKAFRDSKGTHVKGRTRDAAEAVRKYREGLEKEVDKSIGSMVEARKKKMDEASGF